MDRRVYVVARDPFMTTGAAAAAFDAPGFRYRRIGYPLIAGLFGTLTPTGIVIGMIVVAAAAFAVSAAAVTSLPGPRSSTARGAIAVMVAPGLWLSVRLLTVDALAFALLMVGLSYLVRHRWLAATVVFALAALTKEAFLIAAVASAIPALRAGLWRRAMVMVGVPFGALFGWSLVVTARVGGGFSPRENLGLPFVGMTSSIPNWLQQGVAQTVLGFSVIGSLAFGVWVATRSTPLVRWHLMAWIGLAVLMSDWVWTVPGNAARAALPIWGLIVVGLVLANAPTKPATA